MVKKIEYLIGVAQEPAFNVDDLNHFGQDGWELAAVVGGQDFSARSGE